MDHQLWRLVWALPLVIGLGVLLIACLKRMGLGGVLPAQASLEPVVLSRTALSEHTQVFVVEVQQQRFLVFESTAQVSVQPAQSPAPMATWSPMGPARSPHFSRQPWRKTS